MGLIFRGARREELPRCARLLKEAFQDYPFFQIYVDDPLKRAEFNDALLTVWTAALKRNTVLVGEEDGELLAVAELQSPEDKGYSGAAYLSPAGLRALRYGGPRNLAGFMALADQAGAPCGSLPGPKWHLWLMGVSPAHKGGGLGSRMLRDCVIPHIAAHGGGTLVLNTNTQANRGFYVKNGFEEFAAQSIPANGKVLNDWCYRMYIPPIQSNSHII